jgi:hypothetical protein
MIKREHRGIIFVDANTIWHRRIAEALGRVRPTIAFLPRTDALLRADPLVQPAGESAFATVGLPPGWAFATAAPSAAILARRIASAAAKLFEPTIVLPSPAYAFLARRLKGRYRIVYYGADDYRSYRGWPAARRRERAILECSSLAVFVSNSLAQRAITEGYPTQKVLVSPNATELRFVPSDSEQPPPSLVDRARPIVGILGAISDRLDLDFIHRVAASPAVGTLLIAGPVDPKIEAQAPWIKDQKVLVTGRLPHDKMHLWAHAMDVAIVPYASTELNWHCSPMRLWDHLATGVPIFSLPTCGQIVDLSEPGLIVGRAESLLTALANLPIARWDRVPSFGATVQTRSCKRLRRGRQYERHRLYYLLPGFVSATAIAKSPENNMCRFV